MTELSVDTLHAAIGALGHHIHHLRSMAAESTGEVAATLNGMADRAETALTEIEAAYDQTVETDQ